MARHDGHEFHHAHFTVMVPAIAGHILLTPICPRELRLATATTYRYNADAISADGTFIRRTAYLPRPPAVAAFFAWATTTSRNASFPLTIDRTAREGVPQSSMTFL
jgi:hypothetical protein